MYVNIIENNALHAMPCSKPPTLSSFVHENCLSMFGTSYVANKLAM